MVKKRKVSGIFDKDLWVKREGGGRGGGGSGAILESGVIRNSFRSDDGKKSCALSPFSQHRKNFVFIFCSFLYFFEKVM